MSYEIVVKELEAQLEEAQDGNVADSDMANMEQRLREERQAQAREAAGEPWYSRYGAWLLGLLVVIAAALGWRLSRRSARSSEDDAALRERERVPAADAHEAVRSGWARTKGDIEGGWIVIEWLTPGVTANCTSPWVSVKPICWFTGVALGGPSSIFTSTSSSRPKCSATPRPFFP